ncbi:MAG: hypothetical protein EOP45_21855 [Sphingobacteriaceae bacterium]|nr:MAG: hypothetical protein EOP45_21855 [Sphingobacteriaceae bacterium]
MTITNQSTDFTKPQPFIKLPANYELSPEDEFTLMERFIGPDTLGSTIDHSETCQGKCKRDDFSRLKEIGFDKPMEYILDHPVHPDIPRFRDLCSFFSDEGKEFLVIKTKTGGGELWYYDELYCTLNGWQKRFDEEPELNNYPLNDDLRRKSQYVWDEGNSSDNIHWFFFRPFMSSEISETKGM